MCNFIRICQTVSKVAGTFVFSLAIIRVPIFPHHYCHLVLLGLVCLPLEELSNSYLIVVLMCISSVTTNVETPFLCLSSFLSLLWWNVCSSLYLFKFNLFSDSLMNILYVFRISVLSDFYFFANIFSQSIPCHFIFLLVSFKEQMLLILMKSNSSIFIP